MHFTRDTQEYRTMATETSEALTGAQPVRRKESRGFASMSQEKQREIASRGGRAAHLKGTAHEWTQEEARNAGRKGGQVSRGGRGRLPEGLQAVNPAPGGIHTALGAGDGLLPGERIDFSKRKRT